MQPQQARKKAIDHSKCNHIWVSNSGAGGDPIFKMFVGGIERMHVKCGNGCNSRAWATREDWKELRKV